MVRSSELYISCPALPSKQRGKKFSVLVLLKKTDLLRNLDITTALGKTHWSSVAEATPTTCVGKEEGRNIYAIILYVCVERQSSASEEADP